MGAKDQPNIGHTKPFLFCQEGFFEALGCFIQEMAAATKEFAFIIFATFWLANAAITEFQV